MVLSAAHISDEPLRRVALQGTSKYVEGHRQFGDQVGLFFDLGVDPEELSNRRQSRPTDFAALAQISDRYVSTLTPGQALEQTALQSDAGDEADTSELSKEVEEQLRELGYIE